MRGTKGVTKRLIAFVLSFIMVAGTFMTDYTIVRASEEVEETTSDVEETSEAEESEEPEAEEEPEATEEEVVEEETETTEDEVIEEETEITEEEVVEEETETTEEVVGEELTDEGLLEEEVLEEEIIEIIEEMIKISFEAGKGGSVSVSEQELGAEDDVEEVTATADEGYEFVNWTKDGKEVSADETFTPAKEAATYVANFEEVEEEKLEFDQSVEVGGMKISLYAKPGVLPNDAKLQVEKVGSTLEANIKEAIDEATDETVEETVSFDINIYSASAGGYVQPEEGTVEVTFEFVQKDTTDKAVSVYHVKEKGTSVEDIEQIKDAGENLDQVSFAAEHFSIYTVTFERGESGEVTLTLLPKDINGNALRELEDINKIFSQSEGNEWQSIGSIVEEMGLTTIDAYTYAYATVGGAKDSDKVSEVTCEGTTLKYRADKDTEGVLKNNEVTLWYSNPDEMVKAYVYVSGKEWRTNQDLENLLGLHKTDANEYYPTGVVTFPKSFVEGDGYKGDNDATYFINNKDEWNAFLPYLSNMNTSADVFSDEGTFREDNGNNIVHKKLSKVLHEFGWAGSQKTALIPWGGHSFGFEGEVSYHLDLKFDTGFVAFVNGNNKITGINGSDKWNDGKRITTRGYIKGETVLDPRETNGDWFLDLPEGYAIEGFYSNPEMTVKSDVIGNPITSGTSEDPVKVYVKYVEQKYTVTFNNSTGTKVIIEFDNCNMGDSYSELDIPTSANSAMLESYTDENGCVYKHVGWTTVKGKEPEELPLYVTGNAIYYAVFEKTKQPVYFYLLRKGEAVPKDTSSQPSANYDPSGNDKYAWKGLAKVTDKNVYDITGEVVAEYLEKIPTDLINKYLSETYPDEIVQPVWYAYKKEADGWHVDGYVKNVPLSITYDSNYPENATAVDKTETYEVASGEYTVRNVFENWNIEGYEFKGWSLSPDATEVEYRAGDTCMIEMVTVFYAVWGKEESTNPEEQDPQNPDPETPDGDSTDDDESDDGGDSSSGGSGSSGGGSSSDGGSTSGGGRSDSDVGRVLGARREDIATASEDGQVLGAVRAPKTSDASRAILWMLVMGTTALGAAAVLAQKKEEE